MHTAMDVTPVVDEEIWSSWVQKGKQQEQATARKAKIVIGVMLVLLAIGGAYIVMGAK